MFNLSEWLISGIIYGYSNGQTSFARVTELTAAYLSKGLITETQAEQIAVACPLVSETAAEEPVTEESEEL